MAQAGVSWLVIVSEPTGTGSGIVSLEVRDNFSTAARQGAITVNSQVFTVVQEGRGTSCSYSIAPLFATYQVGGGTGSINLTTAAQCGWQAVSSDSWIVITSTGVGVGNGTINYTVLANGTGAARDGAILVGGRSFKVKQKGG
jgi:hypothetical protein